MGATGAPTAENGYGQGVTRFHFKDGAVRTGAHVRIRKPVAGSTDNQPSVCMASGRIKDGEQP